MDDSPLTLAALNAQIVNCDRCPRLRAYCAEIARVKRRAYANQDYWGRPVPSFGDPAARVLILGLAPGAHGSNRTGRMFTGDGSGGFLFPVLYEAGFASQPNSVSRTDGLTLRDLWISAVVRCAPPANKPTPGEQRNCAHWLDLEIPLLTNLRVVVCLGKIAFDGFLAHQLRTGQITSRAPYTFRHAAEYTFPARPAADALPVESPLTLLASYHPSLQNTNTGKLTRPMFLEVFRRARTLAEHAPPSNPSRSAIG